MITRRNFITGLATAFGIACVAPAAKPPRTYEALLREKIDPEMLPYHQLASFVTDQGVLRIDFRKNAYNQATFMPFNGDLYLGDDNWRNVVVTLVEYREPLDFIFHLQLSNGQIIETLYHHRM